MTKTQTGIKRNVIEKAKDAIDNFFWDLPWIRFKLEIVNQEESMDSATWELDSNGQIPTDKAFIVPRIKKIPYIGKLRRVFFSKNTKRLRKDIY